MELERIYTGEVTEIDPETMQAKVVVYGPENMPTDWLMIKIASGTYFMPSVGDQVLIAMDEHFDDGVVLGAVNNEIPYNDENTIGLKFPGIEIEINRRTGVTRVKLAGDASLEMPNLAIKGNVSIEGDVDIKGDSTMTGKLDVTKDIAAKGKIDAVGIIKSTTDLQTATFKAMTHTHVSAAPGSLTSPPVPA